MLHTKEGLLFVIQVDHVSGELIGSVIDSFYGAGAKNVQVVSAVTKKNRPSYMIFVDGRPKDADSIERVIVGELASSGWQRILTEHRHTDVTIETREVQIVTAEATFPFQVQGKVINGDVHNARPEYDCCRELKKFLMENVGLYLPLRQVIQLVEKVYSDNQDEIYVRRSENYDV